ncbi:hypothetical protein Q8F55_007090 [Vanrija albida]|uniref:Non-structural maintenance of chromosomes element 4 n=1 Tax=Vanrija albida TaxID=181172 RepID=A0ABR3PZC0_9TREE
MSEAGPSRRRNETQTQSATANGSRRKRRRTLGEDAFAPQDPEELRRMAQGYRDLQHTADDLKANLENTKVEDLSRVIGESSKLFVNVKDTTLAGADARLMETTAETAANLARRMKLSSSAFDIDLYLTRVQLQLGLNRPEVEDLDDDEEDEDGRRRNQARARRGRLGDWETIGWMAAKLYRRVPGIEFMYGPLSVEHKKRPATKRAPKQALAAETRPQELETQRGQATKDITTTNVRAVAGALEAMDPEREGVNFFRFVINPDSFGQTVENVFYASFLVKEQRLEIEVKDDGEIIAREDAQHQAAASNQAVIELDMDTWEDAIKVFDITDSAIPTRAPAQTQATANGQWSAY